MRLIPFLLSAAVTTGLVCLLNRPIGDKIPMPLGSFLSPQAGFWQNADDTAKSYSEDLQFPELRSTVSVYVDERLVPHVFAENDEDLYFVQGYLHAKFRLFQMDLQTKAAEGRVSEIAGLKALDYDKEQRRLGMKYAAENSLREMEKDALSRNIYTAYTAGVNAYIHSLREKDLPLEYKLLHFKPEEWTNLRTALLLKMMAQMLASGEKDLAETSLQSVFTNEQINALYPQLNDSLKPIVPPHTSFPQPLLRYTLPPGVDSVYFKTTLHASAKEAYKPDPGNGSNNWVLAGNKTASGSPILCNDPHLELSLPSIWYEMQLSTPQSGCYGVSLPGSPYIIIGFNNHIAWGVTNSMRDVKDYYAVKFKDKQRNEYWFNHEWKAARQRIETIRVKGMPDVQDTVSYTVFGPVIYDNTFKDTLKANRGLAVKWVAHETGDDGKTFYQLNRATDYNDFLNAIKGFECPGQNFAFASKTGNIALWQQGKFPALWQGQGQYVMPGEDSSYLWQGYIPQEENPHAVNPERGYLFSANQRPADTLYPYFIPGNYIYTRAASIDHYLSGMQGATTQDMMHLQNNYFNRMARDILPLLLKYIQVDRLNSEAKNYIRLMRQWNFEADPGSTAQTIYQTWMDSLRMNIWGDELARVDDNIRPPSEETLLDQLHKDSTLLGFVDDIRTPERETIYNIITRTLNNVSLQLAEKEKSGNLNWAKYKNVNIHHLLSDAVKPFSVNHLPVGGWGNTINAVTHSHGPSWRMIVQLSNPTEAYGVYPGGQSGNPGSPFYDNMINDWAQGKYYSLWLMKKDEQKDARVKWVMTFNKKG